MICHRRREENRYRRRKREENNIFPATDVRNRCVVDWSEVTKFSEVRRNPWKTTEINQTRLSFSLFLSQRFRLRRCFAGAKAWVADRRSDKFRDGRRKPWKMIMPEVRCQSCRSCRRVWIWWWWLCSCRKNGKKTKLRVVMVEWEMPEKYR